MQPNFTALAQRFDHPGAQAVVLMGSYARGEAGTFSDVDLVRFTRDEESTLGGISSYLIDGRLVVVSDVTPSQVEAAFAQPEVVVEMIQGLRSGRALLDKEGFFAALQKRAQAFTWDEALQEKANRWASRQMVGWIEEVRKGLEGLRRDDTGRMLHANFGCSWGLARVICVQRGVLLSGDNALYKEVTGSIGQDTEWARLCQAAYGAGDEPSTLRDRVVAGLRLYELTAQMIEDALQAEDAQLVMETVTLIDDTLPTL